MAGRSMPSSILSTKREMAINAPVLPALTHACGGGTSTGCGRISRRSPSAAALPFGFLSCSTATRIDESRLPRSACAGASSISTTSEAGTIDQARPQMGEVPGGTCLPSWASCASIASGRPVSRTSASGCDRRNDNAAGIVTRRPWSPPIASMAIRTIIDQVVDNRAPRWQAAGAGQASAGLEPAGSGAGSGSVVSSSCSTSNLARDGRFGKFDYSSDLVLTIFLPR